MIVSSFFKLLSSSSLQKRTRLLRVWLVVFFITGTFTSIHAQQVVDKVHYNNYLAILSEYLTTILHVHHIDEQLSIADLDFQLLKCKKVTTYKEEYIYKFGKPYSVKEKEQIFTSFYDPNKNELHVGHSLIKDEKPDWIYLLDYDLFTVKRIAIYKDKSGGSLQYYLNDGVPLNENVIAYDAKGNIIRLGECGFVWENGLLASCVDNIAPEGKSYIRSNYRRFLLKRDESKTQSAIIENNGHFNKGEEIDKQTYLHFKIESTSLDGHWTKISAWIDEPTCQDGIQMICNYYRTIE